MINSAKVLARYQPQLKKDNYPSSEHLDFFLDKRKKTLAFVPSDNLDVHASQLKRIGSMSPPFVVV